MKKIFIKNRDDKKIAVIVEENPKQKGLVFVMHGLGGFKEQKQIQTFARVFWEKGFSTIRFDARNTIGESEGSIEDATISSYYQDLEDVVNWAKTQKFYQQPFYLIGHSLGGICTALYAQKHSKNVMALAPISTVVSGKLSFRDYDKKELKKWERTGWLVQESNSKPGVIKRISWNHMLDRLKYNLLENVQKLTMPTLLIIGNKDKEVSQKAQKILFSKLPGQKELHIIKDAEHTFRSPKHLTEIKKIIKKWIDGVEKKKEIKPLILEKRNYKLEKKIKKIISQSPIKSDLRHSKSTRTWVLKLKPDADYALQIAALAHDIDRGFGLNYTKEKDKFKDYIGYKREHCHESAKIIQKLLLKYNLSQNFIKKVCRLVLNHEFGGNQEDEILKDADSISFFEGNLPTYLRNYGLTSAKNKIEFMYQRMSEKAQIIVKTFNYKNPKLNLIFQNMIKSHKK